MLRDDAPIIIESRPLMNDPQPDKHPLEQAPKRHPLEQPQTPRPAGEPRQRVNLRIPSVTPKVTYVLLAINVVVFLLKAFSVQIDEQLFLWGANHGPDIFQKGEYYRLLTSMFLHAGVYNDDGGFALQYSIHLISNMYVLYAVGMSMERLFGHTRFLIVYLLGGLTGSVASALFGGANVYSVGASGAVFAILGAEFVYLWHHRKLMGAAGRARRQSLVALAVITFIGGLLSQLPGSGLRVDNWGHAGGLVGGLVLSWVLSPILNLRQHPDHPNELLGEDINPLRKHYWFVSLYATVLVVLTFIGVFLARR